MRPALKTYLKNAFNPQFSGSIQTGSNCGSCAVNHLRSAIYTHPTGLDVGVEATPIEEEDIIYHNEPFKQKLVVQVGSLKLAKNCYFNWRTTSVRGSEIPWPSRSGSESALYNIRDGSKPYPRETSLAVPVHAPYFETSVRTLLSAKAKTLSIEYGTTEDVTPEEIVKELLQYSKEKLLFVLVDYQLPSWNEFIRPHVNVVLELPKFTNLGHMYNDNRLSAFLVEKKQ